MSLQQHLPRSSGRESSTEHGHAPWGRGAECTSRNAGLPAIATIITAPVATDVPTTAAPARRTFHQGVPLGSIIAYLPRECLWTDDFASPSASSLGPGRKECLEGITIQDSCSE